MKKGGVAAGGSGPIAGPLVAVLVLALLLAALGNLAAAHLTELGPPGRGGAAIATDRRPPPIKILYTMQSGARCIMTGRVLV
jgi:hypothetical protein